MGWGSAFLKIATLGMVNVQTGSLILKDPITGIGNGLKQAKDAMFNDFDQGVWLGKRVLEGSAMGFSTYALQNLNVNYLHYVVRIDGQNWHLTQVDGSRKSFGKQKRFGGDKVHITIERCYQSNQKFEWYYKGKTIRGVNNIIQKINKQCLQYNVALKNCIDFAKAIYLYARGLISQCEVFQLLFPKELFQSIAKRLFGFIPGSKLSLQIINAFKS